MIGSKTRHQSTKETNKGCAVMIIIFISFFVIMGVKSCSSENEEPSAADSYEYDPAKDPSVVETFKYGNDENGIPLDTLFEVYHKLTYNEQVCSAEINVLFVDGKSENLQITIDLPTGKTFEYSLSKPVEIGKFENTYSFTYTSDEKEKVSVMWKKDRSVMQMMIGEEVFKFEH